MILFNMEAATASVSHFQPIEHGIENWKCIWNHILRAGLVDFPSPASNGNRQFATTVEMWKRAGFWWHAPEYWLLLRVILGRIISSERSIEAAKELFGVQSWLGGMEPHVAVAYGGQWAGPCEHLIEIPCDEGLSLRVETRDSRFKIRGSRFEIRDFESNMYT